MRVVVADFDGDGHLDIYMGNNPVVGESEPDFLFLGDGSGNFEDVSARALPTSSRHGVPVVADLDGDGHLDIFAPGRAGDQGRLLINLGDGIFVDEGDARLPPGTTNGGGSAAVDLDGDGDLDLVYADGWPNGLASLHLLINDGTGTFTEPAPPIPLPHQQYFDVKAVDVDGDFDVDLVAMMREGQPTLLLNDGAGQFSDASAGMVARPPGSYSVFGITFCDVDGDGDLDLWQANGPNYLEQLGINDGTGVFTDESQARISGDSTFADDNPVVCVDLDHDGDLDVFVPSYNDNRVFLNDGAGFFAPGDILPPLGPFGFWVAFGDFDSDGRNDAVLGRAFEGGTQFRSASLLMATPEVPADTLPPTFPRLQVPELPSTLEGTPIRFAVLDAYTADHGASVAAWVVLHFEDEPSQVLPARWVGGDLYEARPSEPLRTPAFVVDVCARDQHGNEGCHRIGELPPDGDTDGDTDGEGTGGMTTVGPDEPTSSPDPENGTGGIDETDAESSSAHTESVGGADTPSGDGCSCRAPVRSGPRGLALLLLGVGGILRRRNRPMPTPDRSAGRP